MPRVHRVLHSAAVTAGINPRPQERSHEEPSARRSLPNQRLRSASMSRWRRLLLAYESPGADSCACPGGHRSDLTAHPATDESSKGQGSLRDKQPKLKAGLGRNICSSCTAQGTTQAKTQPHSRCRLGAGLASEEAVQPLWPDDEGPLRKSATQPAVSRDHQRYLPSRCQLARLLDDFAVAVPLGAQY